MVKLSKPRLPVFHTFIVQPDVDFKPRNWQDRPANYRIVQSTGQQHLRGKVDAWRFLVNKLALESGNTRRWAISIRGADDPK